tara:strand:+ start:612 stop:1673 length:1062 start_codon:yes stop_codon:yes gene_type:complete
MKKLMITALMVTGLILSSQAQKSVAINGEEVKLEDGIYAHLATNKGDILFKFELEKAPITCASFIALAEGNMPSVSEAYKGKPYFDGLTFHRVIPKFMIQGGDPSGNGSGGPGYQFVNETSNDLTHDKGVVSMANAGPNTNGSQFFITVAPTKQLDGSYSIFGKVIKGQEVADAISLVPRNGADKPNEAVVMNKVTILRNGKDAKKYDAPKVFVESQENLKEAEKEKEKEAMKTIDELSKGFEITPSGLRIKITENGEKEVKPAPGQTVVVHYTGTLPDGKKFDSSVDRGQPFSFVLGKGQVIRGWDEGVAKMKVGDKARLVIPPDLGYGTRGQGPIPANSWMIFDIELLEIK